MTNTKIRGSEWRKWDLHLHSCYSWLNNQFPCDTTGKKDIDQYIKKIEESDLSAIGLTNYFNFADEDFELKKRLERVGLTVFLNLELRLTNINKSDDLFDYHIIFDNKLEEKFIKNFLGSLSVNMGSSRITASTLSTKDEVDKAAIDFSILIDKLEAEEFNLKGRYIKGFLSRGHGSATSDGQKKNQGVYEEITRKSDFIIHSSDNEKNLKVDRDYWINTCKYVKPLLQSSDAHCLNDIGQKYSWIKADLTFDGLKQILFEPEHRVSLGIDYPEKKSDYLVIDHIKIEDSVVYLNENLNTIIGGRSTGKSTLINSIAEKQKNKNYDVSKLHKFDGSIEIIWKDSDIDDDREIEFLPQEYMIDLAKNTKMLNELIERIIRNQKLDSQIEEYKKATLQLSTEIDGKLNEYFSLKLELSNLMKPEGDRKGIEGQIESLEQKREDIRKESSFSKKENDLYHREMNRISNFENICKQFDSDIEKLDSLGNISLINNIDLSDLNPSYRKKLLTLLSDIEKKSRERWKEKINELVNRSYNVKDDLSCKITGIEHSGIYEKGQQFSNSNETLSQLIEQIKSEKGGLVKFVEYEESKQTLETKISELETEIIQKYRCYEVLRETLQTSFRIKDLDLEIKLVFSRIAIEDKINYLDSRNQINNIFCTAFNENLDNKLNEVFYKSDFKFNQGKTINELIKDIFSNNWYEYNYKIYYQDDEFTNMSQGKKAFVILKLLLEFSDDKKPVLIDQPEDSLDNRAIYHELTQYLKSKKKERQIILVTHNPNVVVGADAENIIIANQHNRQTPNESDMKFQYANGALENSFNKPEEPFILRSKGIREHVFEILEGGKEAFEKREQKYNLLKNR